MKFELAVTVREQAGKGAAKRRGSGETAKCGAASMDKESVFTVDDHP